MAKPPRLKVFRTPIGFHDAYVAAPSRAAALRAWGSTADLFARGVAEEVTDPALAAEALARPGEVIRRSRGTAAEQLAALPPDPPRPPRQEPSDPAPLKRKSPPERTKSPRERTKSPPEPRPKPPRPDRHALDAAEQALSDAETRHRAAERDLAAREAALAKERRAAAAAFATEQRDLEQARDDARLTYDRALAVWRAA